MQNLVSVSESDRFDLLRQHAKNNVPALVESFWSEVRNNKSWDLILFTAINEEGEECWKLLRGKIEEKLESYLSPDALKDLLYDYNHAVMACEVAQASLLEPHEEQEQWAIWERLDAAQDEQDRIDLYRNEY